MNLTTLCQVKSARCKRTNTAGVYSCEASKLGKFTETKWNVRHQQLGVEGVVPWVEGFRFTR